MIHLNGDQEMAIRNRRPHERTLIQRNAFCPGGFKWPPVQWNEQQQKSTSKKRQRTTIKTKPKWHWVASMEANPFCITLFELRYNNNTKPQYINIKYIRAHRIVLKYLCFQLIHNTRLSMIVFDCHCIVSLTSDNSAFMSKINSDIRYSL